MARIKRKYIESHWLVFAVQGIVALVFGWMVMFSGSEDVTYLITTMGVMLLALGLVELFNLLHRERVQVTWGFTLFAAVFEIAVGLLLVFTSNQDVFWHLILLSAYTLVRGICEIGIAIKSVDDRTDKFIWAVCGVCGVILSFVILNSGHLTSGTFVKFFASYLVILGLGNLFYGIHNRDQKLEYLEERKTARTAAAKKKKSTAKKSSAKKTTKKSTKK